MRIGEVARLTDASYTLELTDEGLKHTYLGVTDKGQAWRIIATNLTLPGEIFLGKGHINDTIIQNVEHPKRFVFVKEKYLEYLNCPTCKREW